MQEVLLVCAIGILCMTCFMLGAKLGQTVSKGEDIKLPTINPLELYREREERKAAQAVQDRVETILQNIDAYDGTGNRQTDVPGR
jgi:hypothetical protein